MALVKRLWKQERGFTLIELLVVIAIMAVLAGVIIPRVTTSLDQSKITTDESNAKLLQSAVERYYFDNGDYPTTDGTADNAIDMDELVSNGYIDEPAEDPWEEEGRSYKIDANGNVPPLGDPSTSD